MQIDLTPQPSCRSVDKKSVEAIKGIQMRRLHQDKTRAFPAQILPEAGDCTGFRQYGKYLLK
jgi:hypothetical protein